MNKDSLEYTGFGFLAGGGEIARLIHAFNWSETPLGPIDRWPQSLKTSVSLMLNSHHPMWIGWGPEITFLYNEAYIQVLSLAKHPRALGRPAAEVWSEIWDICGPLADKVFQKGEASFMDDVRLFMNRGDFLEETFYSFSYSPIRDESGNVGGLFCPSTEITPRVLNTRRLRTLSELAAESMVEKSAEGACAAAAAILAQNRDDIPFALLYLIDPVGDTASLAQAFGVEKGVEFISPLKVNLARSTSASYLWPFLEAFGLLKSRIVLLKGIEGFPRGAAGQPVAEALVLPVVSRGQERLLGILVAGVNPTRKLDSEYRTFFDLVAGHVATAIHNARAAEEEKRRADMLAELDRAKTTFFSNVSHELRTPLTLILGPLEDEMRESPASRQRLEVVHRNGLRLLKLVNTLLDFSRIEAGRLEASYEPVDLGALTTELAGVFRAGIERAGLRLLVDCPTLTEPVFIDREMWEKIVFNLLSNALKFTPQGEIEIKLEEIPAVAENGTVTPNRSVRLSVRDTGIGIPEADLPQVFERFHRVKNESARSHEGTGIGLALVQELTRLHGGSAGVRSVLGQGTTFTVTIPMGMTHLPKERIGSARMMVSTSADALPFVEETRKTDVAVPNRPSRSKRIVLADDNSDMREYVRRILADDGYDVVAVDNGVTALEAIRQQTPALILSDVMMPRLDGFGLLHELRHDSATKAIPLILLSARAGEEARVEGVEAGADDYLIKPFSSRELLARVASHIELARVRKEAAHALHAATAKFRAIFDQSAVFAGIMNLEGTLLEANRLCLDGCGYRAEDVIGRPFWECGWWGGSRAVQQKIKAGTTQAANGVPYLETLPLHMADGTERLVDFALYPIRNDAGEVIFLHPTGVDITERHQAQNRSDFLVQLTQKLSIVSDPEEINRIATREIGQFLGAHRCYFFEFHTNGDRVLIMPDWHGENEAHIRGDYSLDTWGPRELPQAISRGSFSIDDVQAHPWTRNFLTSYRAVKILAYAAAPFVSQGQCIAGVSVTSDRPRHWTAEEKALLENIVARVWPLIERARADSALRETQGALREANAQLADKATHLEAVVQHRTARLRETIGELEAFSYSIAHDMRAPLRSLQGFSGILLEDYQGKLDAEGQRFLRKIATSAGRMDQLIQDVLNYSRVVRGDFALETVEVEELLHGIVDTYPALAPDKVDIILKGPFPNVLGNEAMLMQIFSNLMGNAVKFVSTGKRPQVEVWAEPRADRVRFFVRDNGIGIALDQHEKIFAIFQQVNKDFEGTGIGLSIVKKAVERMGGSIGIDSELGQGSTFWIDLRPVGKEVIA